MIVPMSNREIKEVFDLAFQLPDEQRIRLGRALIESVADSGKPRKRASELVGSLRVDGVSPTDAEVERIIDEHRMEKYGK